MGDESKGPLQRASQKGVIPVTWDAEKKRFIVALRGFVLNKAHNPGTGVDIHFTPPRCCTTCGSARWVRAIGVQGFLLLTVQPLLSGWSPTPTMKFK